MKKFFKLISFSIILLFFSGCDFNCDINYVFEAPLEVSPIESTLHIGDTLHVLMKTDNQALYDTFGKRTIQFPNFDPDATFQLPIIDTYPVREGFILNELLVDTTVFDAKVLNTEHLGLGLFFFDIPKNEFESKIEFKVVLNTPGQYMLVCRDALPFSDRKNKKKFPDRCRYDGILEVYYKIVQGDHSEILENSHKEVLNNYWKYSSGDKGLSNMYYFKVLE